MLSFCIVKDKVKTFPLQAFFSFAALVQLELRRWKLTPANEFYLEVKGFRWIVKGSSFLCVRSEGLLRGLPSGDIDRTVWTCDSAVLVGTPPLQLCFSLNYWC